MNSDWQKLADLWYRKREVYPAQWADDPDRLHLCVVAGAPYGGPVATVRDEHVFQPVKGSLRTELQIWTSAGRLIQSAPWAHTGLLAMGWSAQETLVCVFESGLVRTFTVMCEPLHVFTVDERIMSEGGAIAAALWPNGIALLTRKFNIFVNTSLTRSEDACQRFADFKVPSAPLSLCVLPPPSEESADVQVIVGTSEGPVLMVDRHSCRDIGLTDGPFMAFALSSSGRLLACLSTKGVFKVLAVSDNLQVLDVANIVDTIKKPKQMVWCGDDCIALYLIAQTPSNSLQHILFVGGPQNDWIPYQYDAPLHLVSECDGCRVLGTNKIEFVQRVPPSVEQVFGIGSVDPPAMLCYALERYEGGDVCAQESLRPIKAELPDAVSTCIDAALCEQPPHSSNLLRAASFGRHFLSETLEPDRHRDACKNLRICVELRKAPVEIPITAAQLEKLGIAGLSLRLAQRHFHLLATRICEWTGHSQEKVLYHWACEKIRHSTAYTDEQLCQIILSKFQHCPGIGYAEVARVAAEMVRTVLATSLLNHEPRSHAQVQVLVQLSQEGDEKNREIMLRIALDKAARSWDPDLIHLALCAASGGGLCKRGADIQTVARLVKERSFELQVISDMVTSILSKAEQFDRARMLCDQLDRKRPAAYCALQRIYRQANYEERMKLLRFSKDLFAINDPTATDAEKNSMQFASQACAEEIDLLRAQVSLEDQAAAKHWKGNTRFAGLSLTSTLIRLIEIGEVVEADNLRTQMKVPDKRYWRIKIRGLSNASNFEELNVFATHRTSPIGYELFIDTFLKHGRNDFALALVPQIKSAEQQAQYYLRMGMAEEAQRARSQGQERSGAGRFLNMLGVGR
ncbi:vps16 [Symbiodinium sp. CCMP2592]|nr:vps16 [Symbiodinium sp. CCMP2592]